MYVLFVNLLVECDYGDGSCDGMKLIWHFRARKDLFKYSSADGPFRPLYQLCAVLTACLNLEEGEKKKKYIFFLSESSYG